ncbi:MAG: hypothetical protein WDZ69_01685 [Candidatus Pacearchaeota archaeon]
MPKFGGNFSPEKRPTNMPFIILGGTFAVALIGIVLLFFVSEWDFSGSESNEEVPSETRESAELAVSCNDWDCLIENSKNCNLAKATLNSTINFFGAIITTTSSYEIKESEIGVCELYTINKYQTIGYDEEIVEQKLEEGMTDEEIEQEIKDVNEEVSEFEKTGSVCRFEPTSDLTEYLTLLDEGVFDFSISGGLTPEGFEGETTAGGITLDCDTLTLD